jgi:hypothetical protein
MYNLRTPLVCKVIFSILSLPVELTAAHVSSFFCISRLKRFLIQSAQNKLSIPREEKIKKPSKDREIKQYIYNLELTLLETL